MGKKFEELVRAACIAESEFRSLSDKPKMSIEAITKECLMRTDGSRKILDRLRALLDEQPMLFKNCRAFVRQVMRWFSSGRVSSGIPRDTSRMSVPSRDDAALEVIGTGFGLYLLWALAAQNVHAKTPEVFGDIIDADAWRKQYEELKVRRDALLERVGQEFAPNDTVAGEPDSNGKALISFKIARGIVPVVPLRDCGRRLINHLLDSDAAWGIPGRRKNVFLN